MANLISPNVSVTIIDESFFVAGSATNLPLIFIATEDEKLQLDGESPALGTYESGVLRVVTSTKQALELYGIPKYYYAADGTPHHGDARNEYGLDALLKYLDIGNRAYVVRANVNLNTEFADIKKMWTRKIADASDALADSVDSYITAFNEVNDLVPTDVNYRETITKPELRELIGNVMSDVFKSYSFSSDLFALNFLRDHTKAHAAFQDVIFETSGGFIQNSDITGLLPSESYGATISIVSGSGAVAIPVSLLGSDAVSFGNLIDQLNIALGADGTAELVAGRIRVTSTLEGITSAVSITDGDSGSNSLFASLNLFKRIAAPISGTGPAAGGLIQPPIIYNDGFDTVLGTYDGIDAVVNSWNAGSVVATEFTPLEAKLLLTAAADDYDNTLEFRSATSLGANDSQRRAEIVRALSAEVNSTANGVRGENLEYNVVICPGFPELSQELVALSRAMLEEVFVIGETPFDKPPSGPNGINTWARTPAKTVSPNIAYAYPHGLSTNIDGRTILTTAGSTMLSVFAFNDREADVWWAPAGTRRGRVEHLETIGYVSGALGGPTTFVEEFMNLGMRDELYEFPKNINPITFIPGRGILMMGQKTTSGVASALDRINVSRLVKFIKRELRKAMFAFLFEPNDRLTRDEAKFVVDGFLANLMSRRGLYDFASVSDESNNTPDRVDRGELWIDVAIKPIKAVEFIYIPVRVVNTGTDISGRR